MKSSWLFKYLILSFLATFLIRCSKDSNSLLDHKKTEIIRSIDSLNDKAFLLIRKRKYQEAIQTSLLADSIGRHHQYWKGTARSLRSRAYGFFFSGDSPEALNLLNESELIEKELNNSNGLASTYNTRALILKNNGLYKDAIDSYRSVLNIPDTLISEKRKVSSYNNIANAYTKISHYDSAVAYYLKTLQLQSVLENPRTLSIVYTNLGNTKSILENYHTAEDYYTRALIKAEEAEDIVQLAKIHNNFGALYFELNNDSQSIHHFKKSLSLKEQYEDSLSLAKSHLNIGEVFLQKKETYHLANQHLVLAENFALSSDDYDTQAKIYLARAELQRNTKDLRNSRASLSRAEKLSKVSSDLSLKKEVNKNLAEVLNELGYRKQAFQKYQLYDRLNDSVLNTEKLWEVAELEKQHQLKIKQGEIKLVQKDRDLAQLRAAQEEAENKSLYFALFGTGCILILLVLLIIYLQKLRKTNKRVSAQKQELLEERLENLIQNQEIKIINATMEGREKEKAHISKELHNNVGSLLTAVKFHLNGFNKKLILSHNATQNLYVKVLQMVDNVINEVRDVSHRLDINKPSDFNLQKAIVEFSHKVQNEDLKVETSIHGLDNFSQPQTSIFIFRVLQELVNNALKHAKASLLTLYLTRNDKHINIMVEDNGKGFIETKQFQKGIGLQNLKEQVLDRNGNFTVDSVKARGTTVIINLPV